MITTNYFPGMETFIAKLFDKGKVEKQRIFTDIFNATINLLELSLQIFTISTIRVYEERIIKEVEADKKKIKPIKDAIKNKFVSPSIGTQIALARHCFHLIDNTAPIELLKMKEKLDETILMDEIGSYLDDLTNIFELIEKSDENKTKIVGRKLSKKPFLNVLTEFISFRNDSAHLVNINTVIEDNAPNLNLKIEVWKIAFDKLLTHLEPLLTHKYKSKTIDRIFSNNGSNMISVKNKTFLKGDITVGEENILMENWYEDQWNEVTELIMTQNNGKEEIIDLFPFLVLKDDKLYFYKKTKASGYQYFSISDDKAFTLPTKKKFNRNVFKTYFNTNSQALFWTEVEPTFNPRNNVRANVPNQGNTQFIGRKKQISKIKDEIIEIPNQNGILYGPGGVGKTALLIELTKQLFEHTLPKDVLYENIIWVSAKVNFYNWEQNATVSKPQQFESLENILQIILRFFEYEDVDEYSLEELKDLTFQLVEDYKVLLILDNFETVAKSESDNIISFFGSDIKKYLKLLPNNFKVILTSRELIPSGYYQIKLEGLELRESRMLMESIYDRYKNSHPKLSEEQYKLIHEATSGIPIVIKHCLGQIFEFNESLSDILAGLSNQTNEVIKFSYAEIFSQLKKDECYLQILILLEAIGEPLSARQIAIILDLPIHHINSHIPTLLNFQCLDRINIGVEEKYKISKQVGLLAKGLIKEHSALVSKIRQNVATNLSIEKRMDYAIEEFEIIEIFNVYIEARDFDYAEHFLKGEITKRPNSLLLRFHFAIFLRDRKKQIKDSIKLLEELDKETMKANRRDANILLTLANTYIILDLPDFENSNKCYSELLKINSTEQMSLYAGEFYIQWSTFLKHKREFDPLEDIKRKNKIKDLAQKGISLIEHVSLSSDQHKYLYLISQGYFNQWETEKARSVLNKAIILAQKDIVSLRKYEYFMKDILKYINTNFGA